MGPVPTLVIAHRTGAGHAPENSLVGITTSAGLGADAVELDVRRTLDGVPVLMHDVTGWRTARWPLPVRLTPLSWWRRRVCLRSGGAAPTLEDALRALPTGLRAALDLKDAGSAPAALAVVQRLGLDDRVLLWVRDPATVRGLVARAPHIEATLLRDSHHDAAHRRYLDDAVGCGAGGVSLHQDALHPWVLRSARERGLTVYSWLRTIAAHRDRAGAGTRLDGVVTDWPDLAVELLGGRPLSRPATGGRTRPARP